MKVLRWMAVGCVAMAGLVVAFVAGVWCETLGDRPSVQVAVTEAKPTPNRVTTQTTSKPDYRGEEKRSVKPPPPIRVANDPPKAEPVGVTPIPPAPPKLPHVPFAEKPAPVAVLRQPVAPFDVVPDSPRTNHPHTPTSPPATFTNKPDLEFEYAVGKQGKSGVKGVSLFVRDPKAAKLGESVKPAEGTDGKPLPGGDWTAVHTQAVNAAESQKLRYAMPKDGRYEFKLGVTSGNGLVSRPRDTDTADLVVVLDTKPPQIEMFDARVDAARNAVSFQCGIADANLDRPDQAAVEYRYPGGEWKAAKLDRMTWAIPDDAPADVSFRLTVTDNAGNATTRVIEKVSLDTTIPEGKLTKVRAVERKEEKKPEEPKPLPPPSPAPPKPFDEKK